MPRNDTWRCLSTAARGRDAHQGLAEGSVLGGWGGVARSGSARVALAVGRGLAADRRGARGVRAGFRFSRGQRAGGLVR